MAKKKMIRRTEVESESKVVKSEVESEPKVAKSDMTKAKIPIWKYFQLKDPPIHKYTRAYLSETYRGILKIEEDWAKELEKYTRGE